MSGVEWTDAEREAVVHDLDAWGLRSRHSEWTDSETQTRAASDILDALAPHVAARERRAAAKALREAASDYETWPLAPWLRARADLIERGEMTS